MTTKKKTDKDVSRFEELRKRAIEMPGVDMSKITDEPFVMGAEWGFTDNPVTVALPTFTAAELISESLRTNQILNAIRILFKADANRVSAALDTLGKDAGPAALLLVDDIITHFYGKGSVQVFPR